MYCYQRIYISRTERKQTVKYVTNSELNRICYKEGRINVLLWYCLVGAYVGLPLGVEGSPVAVRGTGMTVPK